MKKYILPSLLAAVIFTLSTAPAAMAAAGTTYYGNGLVSKLSVSYSVFDSGKWASWKASVSEDKSVTSNNVGDIIFSYYPTSNGNFLGAGGKMLMNGGKAFLQFGGDSPDLGSRAVGNRWVYGKIVVEGDIVLDGNGDVVSGTGLLLTFSGGGSCLVSSKDVSPTEKEGTIKMSVMPYQAQLLVYFDGTPSFTVVSSAKIKMGPIKFVASTP